MEGEILGIAALGVFGILLFGFPILFFIVLGKWTLFKKAGREGWEAIIPGYSDWVYTEIAGVEWWWFIALIIYTYIIFTSIDHRGSDSSVFILIGLIGRFVCNYNISKKLHKDTGFAVLMTLFPFVMLPIIGLSRDYVVDDSVSVTPNGPFDDKKKDTPKVKKTTEKDDGSGYCPKCGHKIRKGNKFCTKCGKEI